MKVILVNGSPREKGCTYTALSEVAGALRESGVKTEIFHIGSEPVAGCAACYACRETGKCVINDRANEFVEKIKGADGLVLGSPVHFASAAGALTAFMDRVFFVGRRALAFKLGASVVSCRRGGATAAFDRLNKYFTICGMPVVSSRYWNMVHGNTPDEVKKDAEGMETMRVLGRNMAYLLKCVEAGRKAGITPPPQ